MKKFDIKKWMEEQKNLPKEKRSLNSKPPIKNKKKITEGQPSLLNEQVGWDGSINWWNVSGFSGTTTAAGYLYICDGQGTVGEYKLDSTNAYTTGTFLQYSTYQAMGVQNITMGQPPNFYYCDGGNFPDNYFNNYAGFCKRKVGQQSVSYNWITPMDVVHMCLQFPDLKLDISTTGDELLDCSIMHDNPCGGIWVGDAQGNAFTPTHLVGTTGTGTSGSPTSAPTNGSWYNGFMGEGGTDTDLWWGLGSTGINNTGTPTTMYSPVGATLAEAQNNCQGPSGACDDSWYVFGCTDSASTNYNEQDTTNTLGSGIYVDASDSLTYTSAGVLLSGFYGGLDCFHEMRVFEAEL